MNVYLCVCVCLAGAFTSRNQSFVLTGKWLSTLRKERRKQNQVKHSTRVQANRKITFDLCCCFEWCTFLSTYIQHTYTRTHQYNALDQMACEGNKSRVGGTKSTGKYNWETWVQEKLKRYIWTHLEARRKLNKSNDSVRGDPSWAISGKNQLPKIEDKKVVCETRPSSRTSPGETACTAIPLVECVVDHWRCNASMSQSWSVGTSGQWPHTSVRPKDKGKKCKERVWWIKNKESNNRLPGPQWGHKYEWSRVS